MSPGARRKALGKGLSALLPEPKAAPAAPAGASEVAVDRLAATPWQPRTAMDPGRLAELAESIRQSGVVQPILVRPRGDRFQIVAGERR